MGWQRCAALVTAVCVASGAGLMAQAPPAAAKNVLVREATPRQIGALTVDPALVAPKAPAARAALAAPAAAQGGKSMWRKPWPYIVIGAVVVLVVAVGKDGYGSGDRDNNDPY